VARNFNGTSDVLKTSIPTGGNVGFGTFVIICQISSFAATRALMRFVTSGASNVLGMFCDTAGKVGMSNAAAAPVGSTSLATNTWYCIAVGKATGTQTPRVHLYRYDTNAFTHENTGSAIADATVPGTTGTLAIGARTADQFTPCDIAAAGFWARNLSDAEFELLPFSLMNWHALAPTGLWVLDQSDTGQSVPDLTGNGGKQSSLTGTTVSTASVPVFTLGDGAWAAHVVQSVGGTTFNQSVGGTLSSAGAVINQAQKLFGGTLTDAGTTTKQDQKVLAATLSPIGAILRAMSKALAGAMNSTGSITRSPSKALLATLATGGTVIRRPGKALAATLATGGAIIKSPGKALAATLTSGGSIIKRPAKILTGTLGTAGTTALVRAALINLNGTMATAGNLTRKVAKPVLGALTPTGTIVRIPLIARSGALTTSGSITATKTLLRLLTGTLAASGAVTRRTSRTLTGALSSIGTMNRRTVQAIVATLTPAGEPGRQILKGISTTLDLSGDIGRLVTRTLTGLLTTIGQVTKGIIGAVQVEPVHLEISDTAVFMASTTDEPATTLKVDENSAVSLIVGDEPT
jgi:hypothetical protein